ncbi:MAG: cysteine hydrolase family protein [Alphaproteobacteria bacterium]
MTPVLAGHKPNLVGEAPMSASTGPNFARSALIIVDMQNDFLHRDGSFGNLAREHSEVDLLFLMETIPHVQRLADAFRAAERPVIYVAHVLKADYSDAAFPFWRIGIDPGQANRTHCVEGTWGAQIIDELIPRRGEHLVIKKGFGGFANTQLDTILRNMEVNTCVVSGVTTCVCVSNTVRGGVEHNYRMVIAENGVAEVNKQAHASELVTMQRLFADVMTVEDVVARLPGVVS